MHSYPCPICKLEFTTAALARRCELWCSTHKSCNLEIGRLAVNRAALAASPEPPLDSGLKQVRSRSQRQDELGQSIRRILILTSAWMAAEAGLSLWAAWQAHSPALLAFGGDSAIELLSALVALHAFRATCPRGEEERSARIEGGLLLALAVYVTVIAVAVWMGTAEPHVSRLGIVILIASAGIMPLLAWRKRHLAKRLNSAVLRADAAESALCGYFSLIALAGLVANATAHAGWADPAAALAIVPFIVREGWEALRG